MCCELGHYPDSVGTRFCRAALQSKVKCKGLGVRPTRTAQMANSIKLQQQNTSRTKAELLCFSGAEFRNDIRIFSRLLSFDLEMVFPFDENVIFWN